MSNNADFDLVWCAKLAWAQCLPNPGGWSSGWCVFFSQFRWAQHFCLSSIPALLPSPALRTDRALVLKVIYLSSCPPGAQVDSRRACSFLPAPERRPLNLFASVSNAQQVRNEPTAAPQGWEVNPKGEEGWNTGKSCTHIKITRGHCPNSHLFIYTAAYAKYECITLS